MNNIFNMFNGSFGMFGNANKKYNPLINYSWSSTYQANNQMYSTNSGTGTDLRLYSGQGVKFNGVDQSVITSLDSTQTVCTFSVKVSFNSTKPSIIIDSSTSRGRLFYMSNTLKIYTGVYLDYPFTPTVGEIYDISWNYDINNLSCELFINGISQGVQGFTNTQVIGNNISIGARYGNNDLFFNGTLKDLFIFNRALTQTEITKYSTNPNGFFNDALVDDTCVLNMPLAEHSDYCIDYANYSEGILNINGDLSDGTTTGFVGHSGCILSNINNELVVSPNTWAWNGFRVLNTINVDDEIYASISVFDTVSSDYYAQQNNGYYAIGTSVANVWTTFTWRYKATVLITDITIYREDQVEFKVDNIVISKLSGIHQIRNYTDSCRDEAKQLPYGSQNANYKINSLGMRTEESPYFEGSELFDNYGDTGFKYKVGENFTIHIVQEFVNDGAYHLNGARDNGSTNRIYIGEHIEGRGTARIGSSTVASSVLTVGSHLLTLSADFSTSTAKLYIDAVFVANISLLLTTDADVAFLLSNESGSPFNLVDSIKYFQIHQKALTQEEVTKAYTDAVNKGLLL